MAISTAKIPVAISALRIGRRKWRRSVRDRRMTTAGVAPPPAAGVGEPAAEAAPEAAPGDGSGWTSTAYSSPATAIGDTSLLGSRDASVLRAPPGSVEP